MFPHETLAGHVTILERFAAGGLAGAASQLAIYPLEVVKTRMAVSPAATYTVRISSANTSNL